MWFLLLAVLSASFISSESLLRERTIRRDVRLLEKVKAGPSQLELLASQFAVTPSRLSQGDVSSNEEYVTRRRRSSDDCGMPQILNIDPQNLNEKGETIQAIWVGKDEILILASDKSEQGQTTVWKGRSKPSLKGLFRFTRNTSLIATTVYPNSLQTSTADNRATVVAVSFNRQFVYVSRRYGDDQWSMYHTPTANFDPTEELYLSSRNPRHMIIRSNDGELYVTENAGRNWNFITRGVQLVEIVKINPSVEYVYYSTQSTVSDHAPLYRMNIADRSTDVIDHTAYRFRVDNRFLFVSRKNITGDRLADVKSRRLYVATNYDQKKVTFNEVQLPSLQDQQFYVVMATHETGAFIHVYDGSANSYGNLYMSDSSGTTFSLSLRKHLFQVHSSLFGHFTVHDFYEVSSERGVYITTTVNGGNHVSMITYDNGGEWQRILAPSGCSDVSVCSLHLYLKSSSLISRRYNLSSASGPLSIKTAPGIIVAHGNVGAYSQLNKHQKIYVSSDGGHTWKETNIPPGTYVYGIADYGNIIAVTPDTSSVQDIWVSHDRGDCFVKKTLETSSVFHLSRGFLIDPSAASLYGFVMGVEGTASNDDWRVITIYFNSLLNRECDSSDYTSVTAQHCVMGYKPVYNLTKSDVVCYNDASYDYHPIRNTTCQCSFVDLECDYGFQRTGQNTCSKTNFSLSLVCPPGAVEYSQSNSGFRLIPGDQCSKTDEISKLLEKKTHKCTGHEKSSGYDINDTVGHNKGVKVFGGIVIIISILVAATLLTYCVIRCNRKTASRERVYYQRLPLSDPGSKFSANDEDTSDEDLITAT